MVVHFIDNNRVEMEEGEGRGGRKSTRKQSSGQAASVAEAQTRGDSGHVLQALPLTSSPAAVSPCLC